MSHIRILFVLSVHSKLFFYLFDSLFYGINFIFEWFGGSFKLCYFSVTQIIKFFFLNFYRFINSRQT